MTTKRLEPGERKGQILDAAIKLAKVDGYFAISRDDVAVEAGVSFGLVTHYFGTIHGLRTEVMAEAIARDIPEIVATGLAMGDSLALSAPPELKQKAIAIISAR